MEISVAIDAATDRPGIGRARWGAAGSPLAGQVASATGPGILHLLGELLRYDTPTRAFVRAEALSALVERTLIVKPS